MPNPPTIPRPPQDHSCGSRNLTTVCRQRRRKFRRRCRPWLRDSCLRRNGLRGERRFVFGFGDYGGGRQLDGGRQQCQNPQQSPVPQDHSCGSRNLTVLSGDYAAACCREFMIFYFPKHSSSQTSLAVCFHRVRSSYVPVDR